MASGAEAGFGQRETASLIGSDKVQGTEVFRPNGEHIGHIERVMIDKVSGKVAYAVLAFGGILGLGEHHYPLPWSLLTYNEGLGGYEINLSDEQLRGAPSIDRRESDWTSRERDREIHDYYDVPGYWV